MSKEELIELADLLGIEHYNECERHIILVGVNGGASCLYTDDDPSDWTVPATYLDFANHLKQMGRDSLKMELDRLLSITSHA